MYIKNELYKQAMFRTREIWGKQSQNRIKAGNDEDCGLIFQGYNHQNSDRGKARSSKPEAVLKP